MAIDPVSAEIAKWTIRAVAAFVKDWPKALPGRFENHEEAISLASQDAVNWATRLQIFGMQESVDPATSAIALRLEENQRRFQAKNTKRSISEDELLSRSANTLLLGDPGSGKTTTLKRITQRMLSGALSTASEHSVPIVIRFREMNSSESVVGKIAESLGFRVDVRIPDDKAEEGRKKDPQYWIGGTLATATLAKFFTENSAVIILDGLDEFPGDRIELQAQLNSLSRSSSSSRFIVSCRTGDYAGGLEGFSVFQICALTRQEAREIAECTQVDSKAFFRALDLVPYRDIVDRPLFLTQLLILFKQYSELPEQACDVYPSIILLILREWDIDRNIMRKSRYSGFSPTRKLKFLAALSHQLTVKIKAKQFSSLMLRDAYAAIHSRFGLPEDEADLVVTEIESHSGLIVNAGVSTYEFSHLPSKSTWLLTICRGNRAAPI